MSNNPPVITLLTDFGNADAFVGTMKGVMLRISPSAQLVDLSHLIPPQDVRQAAFILMTAVPFFPDGTVHLVVVDPGVGSVRRPIAVQTPTAFYIAPDNGVLSYVLVEAESFQARELTNPRYRLPDVSTTFHGRDIFSPAAGHLAAGAPFESLGPELESIELLELPRMEIHSNRIEGEVLRVDHFGNIRTSIQRFSRTETETLTLQPLFVADRASTSPIAIDPAKAWVQSGKLTIEGLSSTFSEVSTGRPLAFVGSEGGLEIAINQGSAAQEYGIRAGDPILLHITD
jgi:S-adenosylmethionine hydrolase